jgi:hypothetical protein
LRHREEDAPVGVVALARLGRELRPDREAHPGQLGDQPLSAGRVELVLEVPAGRAGERELPRAGARRVSGDPAVERRPDPIETGELLEPCAGLPPGVELAGDEASAPQDQELRRRSPGDDGRVDREDSRRVGPGQAPQQPEELAATEELAFNGRAMGRGRRGAHDAY